MTSGPFHLFFFPERILVLRFSEEKKLVLTSCIAEYWLSTMSKSILVIITNKRTTMSDNRSSSTAG